MTSIMNFIKEYKIPALILAFAMLSFGGMMAVQGCSINDYIKHSVPSEMQSYNDFKPQVSLTDSQYVLDAYMDSVERNLERYSASQEQAGRVAGMVNSMVTVGMPWMGNSGIPGGAILMGLLGSLAGLYIPKPGSGKDKEASFNKGQERALEMLKEAAS